MTITARTFHTRARTIDVTNPEERVRDLLTGAFEGGWCWADVTAMNLRDGLTIEDFEKGGSEAEKVADYFPSFQLVPFAEGCSLTLRDHEDDQGVHTGFGCDATRPGSHGSPGTASL